MMNEEMEKISKVSMQIILHAGDARDDLKQAFNAMLDGNPTEMNQLIARANQHMVEAHKLQTVILQKECDGTEQPHSYLFGHAQDTLMTVKSEIEMVEMMTKMYQKLKK